MYRPSSPIDPGKVKAEYSNDLSKSDLISTYNNMPQDTSANIALKVSRRNQIIEKFIWLIDQNYASFEDTYYGSDASVNFWGDALNLGLTGTASVTGAAHLKSILSAVATGSTGVKTSYLKNYYDSQTRSAVVQQMRALRAAQLAILQDANHMKASVVPAGADSTVAPYSLEQALSDINAYYNAGTIIGALQAISEQAGTAQKSAKESQVTNSKAKQLY